MSKDQTVLIPEICKRVDCVTKFRIRISLPVSVSDYTYLSPNSTNSTNSIKYNHQPQYKIGLVRYEKNSEKFYVLYFPVQADNEYNYTNPIEIKIYLKSTLTTLTTHLALLLGIYNGNVVKPPNKQWGVSFEYGKRQ